MSKILIPLVLAVGVLVAVAPAQSQQPAVCPPGQSGNPPYCQTPPPGCEKLTAKLELARATFSARRRTIDVLAPITSNASGRVRIGLQAAGRTTTFTAPIDSALARIKVVQRILRSQALLGTGILTITYNGDADTRPQVVRLRAANNRANLELQRPTISPDGFLRAQGTISSRARGIVRVQLEYVNRADGRTVTLERNATISNGRWNLNSALSPEIRAQIAARCGTVHSYTLFTGYLPARIRGEMKSFQVLPPL